MENIVKLHENSSDFAELLRLTAEKFNILQVFIEKDYWLTRALQRMTNNPNADKVVFKGGTALSKAFRLTEPFTNTNPLQDLRHNQPSDRGNCS